MRWVDMNIILHCYLFFGLIVSIMQPFDSGLQEFPQTSKEVFTAMTLGCGLLVIALND
jgi:hypothetical protein